MRSFSLHQLRLQLDDWRVSQHFKRVERILRNSDVSHLSPDLQQARQQHIDQLHRYATRGIFPRNHEQPNYAPCFIDRDDRECAVAHLVMTSGQSDLAHKIAITANYAYIPQMIFPELDAWAAQTGLSKKELALIQPSYYTQFDTSLLWMLFFTCTTGIVTVLINGIQMARHRNGVIVPVIGMVIATILLAISILYVGAEKLAHIIATQGYISLFKTGPYLLYAVIGIGIALLTGGIALRRMGAFQRNRHTATPENQAAE